MLSAEADQAPPFTRSPFKALSTFVLSTQHSLLLDERVAVDAQVVAAGVLVALEDELVIHLVNHHQIAVAQFVVPCGNSTRFHVSS